MIDFARRRLTMVETQLRPNEVTDRRLLAAMGTLPRERFVPERFRAFAYIDEGIEVFPAIDAAPAGAAHQKIVAMYVPEKGKKTQLIQGSPAEAAKELVRKLRDEARVL